MEAIVERFPVWCPEKGLPGGEPHLLFFQAKRRIEDVSTKVTFLENTTRREKAP